MSIFCLAAVFKVGFRYGDAKAMAHDLTGWVRNNDDGTVEMEAEGTEDQLKTFVASLDRWPNRLLKLKINKLRI